MATNSGVYYPSPEVNAKFIEILDMFKHLSPAIHERLQNPYKGVFGGPKKASKVNQFKYYNNPSNQYPFDQVQLLKEWYMTVNVLLNGEYDYNSPHDDYKSYVIDEIKGNINRFKDNPNISGNIRIILTPLVDEQYDNALTKNIRLDRRKLYIINALGSLIDNFALLTKSTLPRIKSLALNTTTNGKRYNMEKLTGDITNYIYMIRNPETMLKSADRSVRKLPNVPSGNTRSNFQKLENRLVVLKTGTKGGKHHMTKKRSTHKKRTHKRKH